MTGGPVGFFLRWLVLVVLVVLVVRGVVLVCLFVGFVGLVVRGVVVVGGYLYHDTTIHGRTDLDEVDGQLEEEGEAAEHEGAHDGAQQAELAIPGIWIGMDMGGGCGGSSLDLLLAIPGM